MAKVEPRFLRSVKIGGVEYSRGDMVPAGLIKDHRLRQMTNERFIEMIPVDDGLDVERMFALEKQVEELTATIAELSAPKKAASSKKETTPDQTETEVAAPDHLG
jgi:hypothetical protein